MFYQFFAMLRNELPAHHARGGTLADLVDYVGRMPFDEQQTMLDVAGAAWVNERAEQLHLLDPDMLEPVLAGNMLAPYAPDALLGQVRCLVRLMAAQYEKGGAMTAQDVERAVAHLAHCEHTVSADVRHGIHEERPDEYLQALIQFITEDGRTLARPGAPGESQVS